MRPSPACLLILALALAPPAAPSLPAQDCAGGDSQILFDVDSASVNTLFGEGEVAGAGDMDGDGIPELIVGAPWASPGGNSAAGTAFVYSGATGALLYRFDGANSGDFLGVSVSGAGDVDGDGFADVIIGAQNTSLSGFTRGGSAYVYSGATGAQLFRFDGSATADVLGASVAGAGDVDGDGLDDLLVGATGVSQPSTQLNTGAAYVFSGADGSVLHVFYGQGDEDRFGSAVASAGDVDADGVPDILAGAFLADNGIALRTAGAAYVYSGATGQLLYEFLGQEHGGLLGQAVAGAGDVDGDGHADFIIAEPQADVSGRVDAGSVFVHSGRDGSVLYRLDGDRDSIRIGSAVAGPGDVDGDGYPDLLVGASGADPNTLRDAGSAFLYSGRTGLLMLRIDGQSRYGSFGLDVAGAGDVDGDSLSDFAILSAPAARVYDYKPFLLADRYSLSAAVGGRVHYSLVFPPSEAGQRYLLLASLTGTGPWMVAGGCVPLTYDALTDTLIHSPPAFVSGTAGFLGPAGDALAVLDAPPGALASYVGSRFWLAAVSYDPGLVLRRASVALSLDIQP